MRCLAPDQFSILMFVLLKRVPRWRVVPSPESNDKKQGNRAGLFTRKVESSSSSSWGGDKIALHKPVPRRVVPTRNCAPRRPVKSASAYGRQSPADAKSGVGLLSPALPCRSRQVNVKLDQAAGLRFYRKALLSGGVHPKLLENETSSAT